MRIEVAEPPTWVYDCNCTLCRRYGVLWAYYTPEQVHFTQGLDQTDAYIWGQREFAFHRCRHCGCVTHHTVLSTLSKDAPRLRAINARMISTLDTASVRLQHTDNSHTGWFWTRTADHDEPGGEPKMAPPGPDSWR